jgi:membrane associated rhomboid family serine protease
MGLHDRQYYRYEASESRWQEPGSGRSIVRTLIIINAVIFFLDAFSPATGPPPFEHQNRWLSDFMSFRPADLFDAPWNCWRLLTYGFAHASITSQDSIFHVGGNMLVLFFLGRAIEDRLGRWEFLRFYLLAIVVAGLGYAFLAATRARGTVGASGAVSAVIALFVFYYPRQMLYLFGVLPIPAWAVGVLVVFMDMMRSLAPESRIAWQAHLVGFAFGAAYYALNLNFGWLQADGLKSLFARKTTLRIHKPDRDQKLQAQADAILQKISEQGEASLSSKERDILRRYSEQIRKKQS